MPFDAVTMKLPSDTGDCREVLPLLAPCDLILADPPCRDWRVARQGKAHGSSIRDNGTPGAPRLSMATGPGHVRADWHLRRWAGWMRCHRHPARAAGDPLGGVLLPAGSVHAGCV